MGQVLDSPELQLPPAAHNLRWRLRHDRKLQDHLRGRARAENIATISRSRSPLKPFLSCLLPGPRALADVV